jgi:hypothetical protein
MNQRRPKRSLTMGIKGSDIMARGSSGGTRIETFKVPG